MEYILPAIRGLGTGFVLSLMLGTVFFFLIQNSISNGFRSGLYVALGVIISDIVFISVALFGSQLIPDIEKYQYIVRIAGGALLVLLGVSMVLKRHVSIVYPKTKLGDLVFFVSRGFLLNFLNPVNFFSWLALVAYNTSVGYRLSHNIIYFTACLAAIFATELLISLGAIRIKRFFNEKVMLWINRITGSVFLLFGMKLLLDL